MLPPNPRWPRSPALLVAFFSLLAMLLLLALAAPWLLWAYNVEQAGRLLEQGVRWPDERQVETLPQVGDAGAIEAALGHLAAAMRWRDDNEQAYWTAGRAYMAQAAWPSAADALTQARERAPDNPLLAWETGLVYEQLVNQLAQGPQTPLVPAFASGTVEAPPTPVQTPFCGDAPGSCYVGETVFTQPLAAFPEGPTVSAPTLFLHAPAKVRQQVTLPDGQPALTFLLGLDPSAREWGSDGASFQLWVEPPNAPAALLVERTLDGTTARAGWLAEWVDLTPWAGQAVTLALVTGPGPAGNADADWYGWGNLALTTVEAATDRGPRAADPAGAGVAAGRLQRQLPFRAGQPRPVPTALRRRARLVRARRAGGAGGEQLLVPPLAAGSGAGGRSSRERGAGRGGAARSGLAQW